MAKRPIFVPAPYNRLVDERILEFEWFSGFAIGQKRRSIESLHRSAAVHLGLSRVLEVSTKSPEPLGVRLSACNLWLECDARHARPHPVLLEAAFQGSKVFATRGPFTHLYSVRSGREVKRYMKQFSEDRLTGFQFDGRTWGLTPRTAFYDWLYVRALRTLAERDDGIDRALGECEAFTDIEFNPEKSLNCQARSCALYAAFLKNGDLRETTSDPVAFLSTLRRCGYDVDAAPRAILRRNASG